MPLLFSYGSLQKENVQMFASLGHGSVDAVVGVINLVIGIYSRGEEIAARGAL